jgi:2-iminoacetate synthase
MTFKTTGQDAAVGVQDWIRSRIKPQQIEKYLDDGRCFIDAGRIETALRQNTSSDPAMVEAILAKSLAIETLTPQETATLLNVRDEALWARMMEVAGQVKRKVYDNRIVTFAPLYLGNLCVNKCLYCGFREDNAQQKRRKLGMEEIDREIEILAGKIGHKRLIVVYGEHPQTDADYICQTMQRIYAVKVKTRNGIGSIRRLNVNAAPMSIEDLVKVRDGGLGTYQVFQETYHRPTYATVHPAGTIKGDYLWRLYAMHRAMEAGIDDVGIGPLFGLYDWKFEVMGVLCHARELEAKFGIGPHTVSFPRLEPADNSPLAAGSPYKVSDDDFKKIVTVIRLAVPYTGMILTARENAQMRRECIPLGCTQTDASTQIGIGGYTDACKEQRSDHQQFILGDDRSLDDVVRELALAGCITSFCTAGYRCGRTGPRIMDLLKSGAEGQFCKLNAVITFREWLDDFASPETMEVGEKVIAKEIDEIKAKMPQMFDEFMKYYKETAGGARDKYF